MADLRAWWQRFTELPRRTKVIAASMAGVTSLLGLAAVLYWPRADGPPPLDTVVVRTAAEPAEAPYIEAATKAVTLLPNQLAAGDTSGLTESAAQAFVDVQSALPAGATLTVDVGSWRRTGVVASLTVTVAGPDGATIRFAVVLMLEDDAWKVSSTVPLGEAS